MDKSILDQPEWYAFGGGAIVVALWIASISVDSYPPLSTNVWWRIGMAISSLATAVGFEEICRLRVWPVVLKLLGRERPELFLRPKALAFGTKMRAFYTAHKFEPDMPIRFTVQFYAEMCEFKDRFATALGSDNVWFVPYTQSLETADGVEFAILTFEREAAQIAHDIPA